MKSLILSALLVGAYVLFANHIPHIVGYLVFALLLIQALRYLYRYFWPPSELEVEEDDPEEIEEIELLAEWETLDPSHLDVMERIWDVTEGGTRMVRIDMFAEEQEEDLFSSLRLLYAGALDLQMVFQIHALNWTKRCLVEGGHDAIDMMQYYVQWRKDMMLRWGDIKLTLVFSVSNDYIRFRNYDV